MAEPEPLPELEYKLAVEFPALLMCDERDCGGHRKALDAEAAAEFLVGHARDYHDGRFIRFRLLSQKPTDLASVLRPSDTRPVGHDWPEGPYQPPQQHDSEVNPDV